MEASVVSLEAIASHAQEPDRIVDSSLLSFFGHRSLRTCLNREGVTSQKTGNLRVTNGISCSIREREHNEILGLVESARNARGDSPVTRDGDTDETRGSRGRMRAPWFTTSTTRFHGGLLLSSAER